MYIFRALPAFLQDRRGLDGYRHLGRRPMRHPVSLLRASSPALSLCAGPMSAGFVARRRGFRERHHAGQRRLGPAAAIRGRLPIYAPVTGAAD